MNIMKKIQADENGRKYMLFRINIYFSECILAVEITEKWLTDREFIFEKRQETLEKKLGCKFIRINTSNAKKVMISIMRLVMYNHLLMSSKTKK